MNLATIHAEIAKERFLDIMADKSVPPVAAAVTAIQQADKFLMVYRQSGQEFPERRQKGCRSCFGSGGKKDAPCKVCNGKGKVMG